MLGFENVIDYGGVVDSSDGAQRVPALTLLVNLVRGLFFFELCLCLFVVALEQTSNRDGLVCAVQLAVLLDQNIVLSLLGLTISIVAQAFC